MTTRQKVIKLAAETGATVTSEYEGQVRVTRVEAPRGHHWACAFIHELVDTVHIGPPDWADILDRMQYGVEPCGDECEWW